MAKHINFKDVKIGDFFCLVEGGESYDYKKISAAEAERDGIVTDFSPEYAVDWYLPSVESPEFPTYYDAQGHEHVEL